MKPCKNRKCGKEIQDDALFCPYCGRKQTPDPRKRGKRPNRAGTVYSLSGKRRRPWVAARSGTIIGYYETKLAALEALEKLAGRQLTDRYNFTFSQVYEEWKLEHFRTLTEKGIQGYESAFQHFTPLHTLRFRTLRTKDYQSVIDGLEKQGKSSSLCEKLKQLVGQMSKWAMREDLIDVNYASFIKIKKRDAQPRDIFTDTEIAKLERDGSEEAQIVLMMIYTGVRIGELFGLLVCDYHETYCIGGEKTEAGRNRIIPIPPEARRYFQHFAEKAAETILDGYSGNKVIKNFRRREYKDLLDRLGIEYKTPHCTRHTFASRAVKSGVRPELLQKILGHADYSTTAEIYVHSNVQELVDASESIWSITNKLLTNPGL